MYLIRLVFLVLFFVACVLVIAHFPDRGEHADYLPIDKVVAILMIAQGQITNIYGYDNWYFQFARLVLPLCFAWAIIEAIVHFSIRFLITLAIRYFFCEHVIVFGIGEKGFTLTKELFKQGHIVVVVDKDVANPYFAQIERRNGFTLVGDATDNKFLKTLGLHRAVAFYAMTGDDTVNIDSAIRLKEYFQGKNLTFWNRLWRRLCGVKNDTFVARIQVHNSTLRRLAWESSGPFSSASISENTKTPWTCYPFSAYDQAAKMMVEEFSPDTAEGKTKPYHVVIVGFGWFGERTALQVIRMCQTPHSGGQKTVINIIDNQADLNQERFYQRYPAVDPANEREQRYGQYAPLAKLRFIQKDIQRMSAKTIKEAIPDIDEHTVVYICLSNELLGAEVAMMLHKITRESSTRIVLALPETARLSEDMQGAFTFKYDDDKEKIKIALFRPLSKSCVLTGDEKQLGGTIDEMGKAIRNGWHKSKNKPLDTAAIEKDWSESAEWRRESDRQSASHVFFKLRMAGVENEHLETITKEEIIEKCSPQSIRELLAEVEHDRWVAERLLDGWTHGARNDSKRQHPNIQPFTMLNKGTQDIDFAINDTIPEVMGIWKKARKNS